MAYKMGLIRQPPPSLEDGEVPITIFSQLKRQTLAGSRQLDAGSLKQSAGSKHLTTLALPPPSTSACPSLAPPGQLALADGPVAIKPEPAKVEPAAIEPEAAKVEVSPKISEGVAAIAERIKKARETAKEMRAEAV